MLMSERSTKRALGMLYRSSAGGKLERQCCLLPCEVCRSEAAEKTYMKAATPERWGHCEDETRHSPGQVRRASSFHRAAQDEQLIEQLVTRLGHCELCLYCLPGQSLFNQTHPLEPFGRLSAFTLRLAQRLPSDKITTASGRLNKKHGLTTADHGRRKGQSKGSLPYLLLMKHYAY